MKTACQGKWNVRVTNTQSGKRFVLTYDGYKTKAEALMLSKLAEKVDNGRYTAEVIKW